MLAKSVDEVIIILEKIIVDSKAKENPLGYFAALYKKVTQKVKEGIADDFFDDGARMEKLDIIFANRYLDAYFSYQKKKPASLSWEKTFELDANYWPIVLQHLLLGMNAHINLDLGIAAAEVMKGSDINHLKNDFNKINEILSALILEVEEELSSIWPTLKKILKVTQKIDGFLVGFSMELARDGAWRFAEEVHSLSTVDQVVAIAKRDEKVSKNVQLIISNRFLVKLVFGVIRIGERGDVAHKIEILNT